ncbi:hypothetical protein DFH08DRAFT_816051 [Mycena albidolilacea]|uniref:Uncharacterized protein n=1 Tax=Mycena albidolilacea TaxID=1033008 RepID=A0AAD6ZKY6_9AGAR|nr:hypothetical protein DFH08DRAFT_816051 [Mycena albidolilacea]
MDANVFFYFCHLEDIKDECIDEEEDLAGLQMMKKSRMQHTMGDFASTLSALSLCSRQKIEGKIRASIKTGQKTIGTIADINKKVAFDQELLSYQQTAEWGICGLQDSFGRLQIPLEIGHQKECGEFIEICVHLNNVCAELVGINQIHSVYMPLWKETRQEEEVWSVQGHAVLGTALLR